MILKKAEENAAATGWPEKNNLRTIRPDGKEKHLTEFVNSDREKI